MAGNSSARTSGDRRLPNGIGVALGAGAGANRIGTDGSPDAFNEAEGNVISGNNAHGVQIGGPAELYGPGLTVDFAGDVNPGRVGLGSVTDAADLSAEVFVAYSSTTLHLAVRVRDQFIDAQSENAAAPFLNDSIELFFDGDRAIGDKPPLAAGSREGFQVIADTLGNKFTCATDFTSTDWTVATSTFPGGYVIEFAIPLGLIDTQDGPAVAAAGAGSNIRFNLAITDNDRLTTTTQETYGILAQGATFPSREGEAVWVVDLLLDDGQPASSTAPLLVRRRSAPMASSPMVRSGVGPSGMSSRATSSAPTPPAWRVGNGGDGVRIEAPGTTSSAAPARAISSHSTGGTA